MTPQQETLTLDSVIGSRCNNVNLIKLISAFAVIISHSSPLFGESSVLLSDLLSHLPLGTIAVSTFFFFAGLYIAKSCESHPTPSSFFRTRCKRLIPELALVTAACVFIVGPIFSIYKLSDYFSRPATYAYLLNAFLIPVHNLPGVFLNNPYGSTVNGSLWTMPVEFFCYVCCFIAFIATRFRHKGTLLCFAGISIFSLLLWLSAPSLFSYYRPVYMFCIGVLFYAFRLKVHIIRPLGILSTICFFLTAWNGYSIAACFLLLPYTLIWIAFDPALLSLGKPIRQIELSYGIYLWGFPIQQIIAATVGEQISVALAMGLSMVGALLGSYANQLILAIISKIRSDIVQAVHSPSQQ